MKWWRRLCGFYGAKATADLDGASHRIENPMENSGLPSARLRKRNNANSVVLDLASAWLATNCRVLHYETRAAYSIFTLQQTSHRAFIGRFRAR